MTYSIIPVTNAPDQRFTTSLQVDGENVELSFRVRYNTEAGYWTIGIKDISGNQIIDSVPLLTGKFPAANILGQYKHLGIGGLAVVPVGDPDTDYPDETNLGTQFLLVAGDANEL